MIKIHYKREYFGRLIFIAEGYDGQPFIGYRSSGLAGHNSKGTVLPAYFLKDKDGSSIADEFNGMVVGWIPKVYWNEKRWSPYFTKNLDNFGEPLRGYLIELTEQLGDEEGENELELEVQQYAKLINKEMREIVKLVDNKLGWL